MLIFFFFFKQKTAYEMRISDWSSDVCSSDLYGVPETFVVSAEGRIIHKHVGPLTQKDLDETILPMIEALRRGETHSADLVDRSPERAGQEIGRASCRERVCQYV